MEVRKPVSDVIRLKGAVDERGPSGGQKLDLTNSNRRASLGSGLWT